MGAEPGTEDWHRAFQRLPPGEHAPAVVAALAPDGDAELVWRNIVGGQTWRLGDRFLKWSPDASGLDLGRDAARLRWLEGRFPAPRVLDAGRDDDGTWFLSAALPGASAIDSRWRADPDTAVRAIAAGLRRLHALDAAEAPRDWESWATRRPAALGPAPAAAQDVVLVHGDACAPNTLLADDGSFAGIVDVGDLVPGDRWADLAVASMSLDWNYGPGWQPRFFDAYGVEPDEQRIAYFRALFRAES